MGIPKLLGNVLVGCAVTILGLHPAIGVQALWAANTGPLTVVKTEAAPHLMVEAGGHTARILQLLFTAGGRELISVSDDKTIRVWVVAPDGRRSSLARTLRGELGEGREGMIAAAALSPPDAQGRQQWLAVGGWRAGQPADQYAVRLHDYASGEVVALLHGHHDAILALAFTPSGRWLASAGKDQRVLLWDLSSLQGQRLTQAPLELAGHSDYIYDLAWSATGDRLAPTTKSLPWRFRPTASSCWPAMSPLQSPTGFLSAPIPVANCSGSLPATRIPS
jgi:WD40 repeat protein